VAIAGAGMVIRHHLNAWAKLPQVEIVAICARHLKNAQARAAELNIPGAYDDVAEMLAEEKSISLDLEAAYQKSYDNAIAHFIGSLESGKPFETDRLDNLKTLQLVSDAYDLAGL
jgi:predicted dehydrogenase